MIPAMDTNGSCTQFKISGCAADTVLVPVSAWVRATERSPLHTIISDYCADRAIVVRVLKNQDGAHIFLLTKKSLLDKQDIL